MSVLETNKVDGMAVDEKSKSLVLLISDNLDWEFEQEHLTILQEKINAYLMFLKDEQYKSTYPTHNFKMCIIEIHFKFRMSENCVLFISEINKQLVEHSVVIVTITPTQQH